MPKAHGEGPKTHGIHVRRARPTANPRRRPNTTAKPASPCAFYRAHGKDLSRVFGPANGKLEHMTAGTATGDGNGARRRRRIRSSLCAMDPDTRQRFKKNKKYSAIAAARARTLQCRCPARARGRAVVRVGIVAVVGEVQRHGGRGGGSVVRRSWSVAGPQ